VTVTVTATSTHHRLCGGVSSVAAERSTTHHHRSYPRLRTADEAGGIGRSYVIVFLEQRNMTDRKSAARKTAASRSVGLS
jgi:hypothetical protein